MTEDRLEFTSFDGAATLTTGQGHRPPAILLENMTDPPCIFCRKLPTVWDKAFTMIGERDGCPPLGWHPTCYDREFGDEIADPLRLRKENGVAVWAGK